MTDTDLRDLFHAAAPDVESPHPGAIDRAWRDGSRRRAGARAAVVGSVAATAAAVTGVTMLTSPGGRVAPAPAPSAPTSTPTSSATTPPVAEPSGEYEGASVWLAPSVGDEASLPRLPVEELPSEIDVGAAQEGPVGERVVALLAGPGERAYALTASARVVEVDTAPLDPVTDEPGNRRNPLSSYSLSSDGSRAFFIQASSLQVLDFTAGTWTTIDTPDWLAEGARWLGDEIWVPASLGEASSGTLYGMDGETTVADVDWVQGWVGAKDEPWGPVALRRAQTAQAAFTMMTLSNRISHPQAIMVDQPGARSALALDYLGAGDSGTRYKGCCVALGWVDENTVLFSSSGTDGQRILAWKVGTPSVYRVSDIVGPATITGVADLS